MSTKTIDLVVAMTGDSLNASVDIVAIALDSSLAFYYNSISKKGILDMCQRAIRRRSYWVISCVIIHIMFRSVMIFFVMFCSFVLCYYLYIIPYLKSKCLRVSLERLREPYQTYSITSTRQKQQYPYSKSHTALPQYAKLHKYVKRTNLRFKFYKQMI